MALDDRTAQAQLTPEARRELLRAFADRMLLKITAMDDPADMPGVERAVRVAAVIERVYSRCDRAERQIRIEAPERAKAEAERAIHERAAIKARVSLANTLEWEDKRRRDLGSWWDAAQKATQPQTPAPQITAPLERSASTCPAPIDNKTPEAPADAVLDTDTDTANATYVDYTDGIIEARANLKPHTAPPPPERAFTKSAEKPPPPY